MTNDKYACLVDAVREAGISLPPIKAGTAVNASMGDIKEPDIGTSVDFVYEAADGKPRQVRANDVRSTDEGRYQIYGIGEGQKTLKRADADIASKIDLTTGTETTFGKQSLTAKPGTTKITVERLFDCADKPGI